MSRRMRELARRRTALVARCAIERGALRQAGDGIAWWLAVIDRGIGVVRWVKARPLLVGGAIVAVVLWRPRSLLRWFEGGFAVAAAALRLRGLVRKLPGGRPESA